MSASRTMVEVMDVSASGATYRAFGSWPVLEMGPEVNREEAIIGRSKSTTLEERKGVVYVGERVDEMRLPHLPSSRIRFLLELEGRPNLIPAITTRRKLLWCVGPEARAPGAKLFTFDGFVSEFRIDLAGRAEVVVQVDGSIHMEVLK